MKEQYLRNYLLFSGYCVLPGYLLGNYTLFGELFPYYLTTTSTIITAFLSGGLIYVSTLIYSSLSSSGFTKSAKPWVLCVVWVVLLLEWFGPYIYNTSPFSTLVLRATISDYRRVGREADVARYANTRWAKELRQTHPITYRFIFGGPSAVTTYTPSPPIRTEATSTPSTAAANAPVRTPAPTAIEPVRPTQISGISSSGALLDGKFRKWGKQEDGSTLSLNPDRTSVTLLTPDGETITLALNVE
jgi:hypothetical protein